MLADFGHCQPLPYQSLISVLNSWLSMVRNQETDQNNLSLILEWDDEIVADINRYIKTGDLEELLDFWLPYSSLEMLEFFFDLRIISEEIIDINKTSSEKVNFEILGGEVANLFGQPDQLKYSETEAVKAFVNERDSLSANKIISYLHANRAQKALIFYGSLHLIKNKVNKNITNVLNDEDSYGYYLAHYLKKEFGEDLVFTVHQTSIPAREIESSQFADVRDENILVFSRNIPWEKLQPENYDAFIIRHEVFIPEHPLSLIFSRRIIEKDIEKMKFIYPYLPGFQAQRYYDMALNSLKFLTGKNLLTIEEWDNWYEENGFDGLARLNSEAFAREIFDDYYQNYDKYITRQRLFMLGFGPAIMSPNNIPDSTTWKEVIWPDVLPKIIQLNAIGINWIGYPDEKAQAMEILLPVSEERTHNSKYLKYWRKGHYNATY